MAANSITFARKTYPREAVMKDEKKITEENKSNKSGEIFKKIIVVVISAICLIGSFFAGFVLRDVSDPDMASLKFIVETYKKYYLEESDDFVSIMGNSIIDRYSEYMTKEEYEAVVKGSAGRRKGIGIGYDKTTLKISTVNGNSPAQKAGIKEGDVIRAVKKSGEDNFTEVGNSDELSAVFSSIADDEEFSLKLDSSGGEKIITVARADYQETYVFYKDNSDYYCFQDENGKNMSLVRLSDGLTELDDKTAYIRYSSFNGRGASDKVGSSPWQMKTALKKFKADGKSKLILDLRNNGGGYMDILEEVSSHFIGAKKLISKAVYKDGSEDRFVSSSVDYADYGFEKIVILANSYTASASEALIGAILDYDAEKRVSVVLSATATNDGYVYRSYGKGIMQTTFRNPVLGDAIKLTTAKIYWPVSGVSIHGVGVSKESLAVYADRIYEPAVNDSIDYELKKAVSLLR